MNRVVFILFLIQNLICLGQSNESEIEHNFNDSLFVHSKIRHFTIGGFADISNSIFGTMISNGIDEKPLLHFEDLPYDCLYKMSGQVNFKDNYSYEMLLGWNKPSRRFNFITVNLLGINYSQRLIKEEYFFQRKLNLTGEIYVEPLSISFSLLGKLGLNQINNLNNYGGEIGFRQILGKAYIESSFGYYSDFYTFSAIAQCNIYKKLYTRIIFEQIENFNSLNMGIHYTFSNFK